MPWKKARKLIKEDPRYKNFGDSDHVSEHNSVKCLSLIRTLTPSPPSFRGEGHMYRLWLYSLFSHVGAVAVRYNLLLSSCGAEKGAGVWQAPEGQDDRGKERVQGSLKRNKDDNIQVGTMADCNYNSPILIRWCILPPVQYAFKVTGTILCVPAHT